MENETMEKVNIVRCECLAVLAPAWNGLVAFSGELLEQPCLEGRS